MKKLVIGSTEKSAGKTSLIVGIAKAMDAKFGYIKPFGDRLLYRKKRLWDYDPALIANLFGLTENPEDTTLGFEHSKLRYMYDEASAKSKLVELVSKVEEGKDFLFIEGGQTLRYGVSVFLDTISLAKVTGSTLVIVVSGDEDTIMDNIAYIKKYIDMTDVDFGGIIINKVPDINDFTGTYMPAIKKMGIPIIGVIPNIPEFSYFTVDFLTDALFAKVIAGEKGTDKLVKNVLVGAMTVSAATDIHFQRENKIVITSGDRHDMLIKVINDIGAVGIVITNNIIPPSNITAMASEKNIPLLLVPYDTFEAAKRVENLEPLMTKTDSAKVDIITKLVKDNLDLSKLA